MENVNTEIIGMDLSDKSVEACVLDVDSAEVQARVSIEMDERAMRQFFESRSTTRVIMEAGTHSPWLSRLLEELGHQVRVADPRRIRLISENARKSDENDAEILARLERVDDLELVRSVEHREEQLQADFALVKARDQLVKARTQLINCARGLVKSIGGRLPGCSTASFVRKSQVWEAIPPILRMVLHPLMETIGVLSERIKDYDRKIEQVLQERYPEANQALRQVKGVGAITALCFICVIQDPDRFEQSRSVGAYVGLSPGRNQSGESDPKQGITKSGDALLRCQLTRAAHYILTFGEDSDLRRFGHRLLDKEKPRQVAGCAVGRKLAVLLHRLWKTKQTYEPLYQHNR